MVFSKSDHYDSPLSPFPIDDYAVGSLLEQVGDGNSVSSIDVTSVEERRPALAARPPRHNTTVTTTAERSDATADSYSRNSLIARGRHTPSSPRQVRLPCAARRQQHGDADGDAGDDHVGRAPESSVFVGAGGAARPRARRVRRRGGGARRNDDARAVVGRRTKGGAAPERRRALGRAAPGSTSPPCWFLLLLWRLVGSQRSVPSLGRGVLVMRTRPPLPAGAADGDELNINPPTPCQ